MKFRLKGTHRHQGRTYRRGDVIDSETDLRDAFPSKFELLDAVQDVMSTTTTQTTQAPEEPDEEGINPNLGTDVTRDFENARANDLLVYKKQGLYYVCDDENPTQALNEMRLRSPKAVKAFISKYVGPSNADDEE